MRIGELSTPCALVDLDQVEKNTRWMSERAHELGVRLRPHVKTHKCLEAARLQVDGHFGGITVSTLAEASYFAKGGFQDITWAFPLPVGRVEEALEYSQNLERFSVVVDHVDTVDVLERCAGRRGIPVRVFLKFDCGYGRAGVRLGDPLALTLARRLSDSPWVDFRGVLAHAGHSYDCRSADAILKIAEQERESAVSFAEALRGSGVEVPEVSVGSTPTMRLAEDLEGVTEIRPGNYVFFDWFQSMIGSCQPEEIAFSVLASVVGRYPERGSILLDAGALALSKDVGVGEGSYGCLANPQDGHLWTGGRLTGLSQEHGKVQWDSVESMPEIGDRVRILPNHSCLSAALHPVFYVVRGMQVVDTWRPCRGW
ncbi:MAG: alanine racemase [Myxococcota bacterium]|nr:alanine racemase [Myxococcota bacterium]